MSTSDRRSPRRKQCIPQRAVPVLLCDGCRMSSKDITTVALDRGDDVTYFRELCGSCADAACSWEPQARCRDCGARVRVIVLDEDGLCPDCVEQHLCVACHCVLELADGRDDEIEDGLCTFCRAVSEYEVLTPHDAAPEGLGDELWTEDCDETGFCSVCGRPMAVPDDRSDPSPLGANIESDICVVCLVTE